MCRSETARNSILLDVPQEQQIYQQGTTLVRAQKHLYALQTCKREITAISFLEASVSTASPNLLERSSLTLRSDKVLKSAPSKMIFTSRRISASAGPAIFLQILLLPSFHAVISESGVLLPASCWPQEQFRRNLCVLCLLWSTCKHACSCPCRNVLDGIANTNIERVQYMICSSGKRAHYK